MKLETKIKWASRLWRLLGRTPLPILYGLSDLLAWVIRVVVRYRRDVVDHNIGIAFPGISAHQRDQIADRFYRYFCDMILEAPKMMTWSAEEMKEHMVFENIELLRKDASEGRNFSLYIGHYGQWEWIPSIELWLPGVSCAQIYSQLHDPVADRLIRDNRQAHGSKSVEMRDTLRHIVAEQKRGKPFGVGFVADQSPSWKQHNHFVRFFGLEVPTHVGAEKITRRLGMSSYFLDLYRERRGYWRVKLVPLKYHEGEDRTFPLTADYYRILEDMIRREPAYYLWSHKRFKFAKEE